MSGSVKTGASVKAAGAAKGAGRVRRVVLVPGALALSSRYASDEDPLAELRSAVEAALVWVGAGAELVGDERGVIADVIGQLSGRADSMGGAVDVPGLIVVANGSAKRTEKAPGHFDERALAFDDWLRDTLTLEPGDLFDLDAVLADELWADVAALPHLAQVLAGPSAPDGAGEVKYPRIRLIGLDYDDAPYGVKYWVMRWEIDLRD